jgi:hemolysin III
MTKIKDPVSGFTHLAWAVASIVGLVFLVIGAATKATSWEVVSFTIFGASLILLYTFSSLYHLCNVSEKATKILRKFDHIMIYILIAGTYTPICLSPMRGPWGWSIFGVVWGLALIGTFLTIAWIKAPRWLTTGIYLAMGWTVIVAVYPMITTFNELNATKYLLWLLAGGIFYTVGAIIYGIKKPDFHNKYFGFHEIFHIFVMLGSFCHYVFIYNLLGL